MVFFLDEICTKMVVLPLGCTLCPPKCIITAQIHVKLISTYIILAKLLQQPILGHIGFWTSKI